MARIEAYRFNTNAYVKSHYVKEDIRIKKVLSFAGEGKTVLDLGCFDGTLGELFFKNNNKVYGLDASASVIEKAKARGVEAKQADLEDFLEYPSEMFDVAFAGEVLEHIWKIDQLLSEIYRVLKKGGMIIVTTPNLAALGRRLLLLINKDYSSLLEYNYPHKTPQC